MHTHAPKNVDGLCISVVYLHKLFNCLQDLYVEGFGLNATQVHVTQEAVDDL